MTIKQYKKILETIVIQNILTEINTMLGQTTTSFLSTSLLLQLKPIFSLAQSNEIVVPKTLQLQDLDNVLNVYTSFSNPDSIIIELYYSNKKSIKHLIKLAEKHSDLIAFYYIKQLHASIAQVNSQVFIQSKLKLVGNKENPFDIVATSVDKFTNTLALQTLTSISKDTDKFKILLDFSTTDLDTEIQNEALNHNNLQATKIPAWIRKARLRATSHIDSTIPQKSDHNANEGSYGYTQGANKESVIVDLSITLTNVIATSCKGTGVGNIFAQTFNSVKIKALWFENLTKTLESQIIEKSHTGYNSWANLSKTKRHLYPSSIRITNNSKLDLIVSIDQSGSVSTADLQKILFIFEKYSENIARITVLHHTAAVTQQFTIKNLKDLQDSPEFTQALGTRSSSGGTSHLDVFKRIHKLFKKEPTLQPQKVIYLSFSDNYSDIEDTFYKYDIMSKLTTYWIRPTEGKDIKTTLVGGTNIVTP